jgi:hypothetical protein
MKKTTRRKTPRRAVKDLTARNGAKAVKGGDLMKACTTGTHIKDGLITAR